MGEKFLLWRIPVRHVPSFVQFPRETVIKFYVCFCRITSPNNQASRSQKRKTEMLLYPLMK